MTPVELCEPLFQFVCRLNRSARKGGDHDMDQVRAEVKGILSDIMAKASADPALATQFDYDQEGRGHDRSKGQLYVVLLFFVDFMIRNSALRWAMEWNNLADDVGEQAGDEKFFELLDETLGQRSDAANQRLAVFYTCMGLGFSGWYTGQPEYLRKKMLECAARLRGVVNADEASKVCPEAYERTNTSNLIEKPASSLIGIGITLVVLVVMTLIANAYLYERSASDLSDALKRVMQADGPAAAASQ
jgi:type VI secretion system protein ImpK